MRVELARAPAPLDQAGEPCRDRFMAGTVLVDGRIKQWAVSSPPADHAEILRRWDTFTPLRTTAAVLAFTLLIALALRRRGQ